MTDINREIAKLQEKIQRRNERGQDSIDDDSHLQMLVVQRAAMNLRMAEAGALAQTYTAGAAYDEIVVTVPEDLGTLKDVVREQHDGPREYNRAGLGFFF